jgi:uncharacterized membrane protein YkoI
MKNDLFAMFIFMAALAPGVARADLAEAPASAQGGGAPELDSDQMVLRQLRELSREAKVSLSEAIATAEKLHDGSRTVQIGFERAGFSEYRVRTVRDSVIWENTIDARNGRINGEETVLSLGELSSDDRRDIDALEHVTQQLSEAVLFAEKAVAGKAIGGCLIDEDGTPNFAVVVVAGDRLKQVMLEARRVDRHATTSYRTARDGHRDRP